jgi:hypothetical protein
VRIGISGHRELPAETAKLVADALHDVLSSYQPDELVGVTLLADGADQLFAETILDLGGRLEVIVPAEQYRDGLPADYHATYDRLLNQASDVRRLPYVESTEQAHMAGSRAMLDSIDALVGVWDGKPARGYGGTADVVEAARQRNLPVIVIWPEGSTRGDSDTNMKGRPPGVTAGGPKNSCE